MQIVIDIPEDRYRQIKDLPNAFNSDICKAIRNGIPLPKGHGELIDKDTVLDMMNHGILEDYITTMGGIIPADKVR